MTGDVDRRPTAVTWKSFLLLSSTPTALGLTPLPGSLADTPGIYGQTAALAIWLGCFTSLVGLLWRGRRSDGLYYEQAGLVMVSVGCGLYAIALFMVPHFTSALFAFGLSGGIAAASLVQYRSISRYRRERRTQHG